MNNNYNPMTPSEDSLQKFQWSVHTVKRCSQLFKTLVSDNWSCAGAISPNKDMTTNINEFSIAFYWRKPSSNYNNCVDKTTSTSYINIPPVNSPIFKFNAFEFNQQVHCPSSPPAREVEENITL